MCLTGNQHTVWEFPAQSTDQALADRVDPRRLDRGAQDPRTGGLEDGVDEAVKFEPRSRIRNLMASNRSSRVSARLRACCTVHSPVGWEVTPPRCIRRVPCSINTRTYGLFSSTVSTCGKSTARIPAAWAARNCFQVGPDPRGAGSMPAHAGSPTPWTAPRRGRASSARRGSGRYPHSGFFFASRMTRRAMLAAVGGRRACPFTRVVLLRGQSAVPGQQRRRRDGEDLGPAPAGDEPGQRGKPHPVGRLVPHPASLAAQHCVLAPEHQQTQWPSPGRGGTSAQPRRGRGTSAGRRSLAAPDRPNIAATGC